MSTDDQGNINFSFSKAQASWLLVFTILGGGGSIGLGSKLLDLDSVKVEIAKGATDAAQKVFAEQRIWLERQFLELSKTNLTLKSDFIDLKASNQDLAEKNKELADEVHELRVKLQTHSSRLDRLEKR